MKPCYEETGNRKASPKGGYLFELPIELRYHAEGPACPEWAREGSRFFGAFLHRGNATFMVDMQVDQMLNLPMKIGKTCSHLSAQNRNIVLIDKNSRKDAEKEQEKWGVLNNLIQDCTPAAGCRWNQSTAGVP